MAQAQRQGVTLHGTTTTMVHLSLSLALFALVQPMLLLARLKPCRCCSLHAARQTYQDVVANQVANPDAACIHICSRACLWHHTLNRRQHW